ncbi:MAG: hypothetical protein JO303_04330 [Caulobacteraceae bacterium]|nr:hypothetical protein [Caulobacteraceae bacterium]
MTRFDSSVRPLPAKAALAALTLLTAASLSACGGRHEHMAINSGLCPDFRTTPPAQTANGAADPAAPVDDCVRRWAYSLAGARDDADVVAQSVIAACAPALARWNQNSLGQAGTADAAAGPDGGAGQPQAAGQGVSLTTGESTSPLAAHASFAQQRALLYVIEARAGQCAPPPTANGVPVGTN